LGTSASQVQDWTAVDTTIRNEAQTRVPEQGDEGSNVIREFTDAELAIARANHTPIDKMQFNRTGLYVEDAMPQNGDPYTEGPTFPQSPSEGDYHRLTYVGTASGIPAKLYRWSTTKMRWVYLETDRRAEYDGMLPRLTEYIRSPYKMNAADIK